MTASLPLRDHLRLVLDLDGVIVDTDEIKAEVLIGLFDHLPSKSQGEIDEWNRESRGIPRRRKLSYITAIWDPQHDSHEAVDSLLDRYAESLARARPSRLLSGAELLKRVRRPMHVSSSAPPETVAAELDHHGILAAFESVHGDPPGKVETLRMLKADYPSDEIVMIGDGRADQDAASQTGVTFIGIERQPNTFGPGVPTYPHLGRALIALGET